MGIRNSVRALRVWVALAAGLLAMLLATPAFAAPSFSARGSVEQVYVTGAGARRADVPAERCGADGRPRGRPTRSGGLLFRNVTPGSGYRVRPRPEGSVGPLTVLSTQPAPPSTGVYNQYDSLERLRLPDHP